MIFPRGWDSRLAGRARCLAGLFNPRAKRRERAPKESPAEAGQSLETQHASHEGATPKQRITAGAHAGGAFPFSVALLVCNDGPQKIEPPVLLIWWESAFAIDSWAALSSHFPDGGALLPGSRPFDPERPGFPFAGGRTLGRCPGLRSRGFLLEP
jgi:hypothetical protein